MVSREEALVELYKRGALKGPQAAAVGELIRRGKLGTGDGVAEAVRTPEIAEPLRQFARQATAGLSEAIPAAIAAGSAAVRGKVSFGKAYAEARAAQEAETASRHTPLNDAAGWAGGMSGLAIGGGELKGALAARQAAVNALRTAESPVARQVAQVTLRQATRSLAAKSALAGVGYGGVGGAANARTVDGIVPSALAGGIAGGVVGAASPYAGAVVGGGARKLLPGAQRTLGAVGGALHAVIGQKVPEPSARAIEVARPVAAAYLSRVFPGAAAKLRAASAAEGTAGEALGPGGINQLTSLTRRPGSAAEQAVNVLQPRNITRQERLLAAVHQATGIDPAGAKEGVMSAVRRGRAAADPHFEAIRAQPGPVWNADFAKLAQRPTIRRTLAAVSDNLRDADRDPLAAGIKLDVDTGAPLSDPDRGLPRIIEGQPTAETWEALRQAVGGQVKRDGVGRVLPDSEAPGNIGVERTRKDLTDLMKEHIPGVRQALDVAGDYQRMRGAYDKAGGTLFKREVSPSDFNKLFASAKNAPEQDAFRHRIASDLYDKFNNAQLVPSSLIKAPAVRAKLATAFGSEKTEQLVQAAQRESQMQAAENRIAPLANSVTGTITETAREHDAHGNLVGHFLRLAGDHGPVKAALKTAIRPAEEALTGASAPGNVAFRNELARMLLSHPHDLANELESYTTRDPSGGNGYGILPRALPLLATRPGEQN